MNQNDKIYMNQIWHKIHIKEKIVNKSKEKAKKAKFIQTISITLSALLAICTLFKPEALSGISTFIGFIILSLVTFSEYKKLRGGFYEF